MPGWLSRMLFALAMVNLSVATGGIVLTQSALLGPLPVTIDFVSFYAAGSLTNADSPALVYDQATHQRAEEAATRPGGTYQLFFYPPVYLLVCQLLARLPYLASLIVFEAVTLGLFLMVARRVAGPNAGGTWLLPVLAFPPVFWNIVEGQNAFLTAALMGGGTLLAERRPIMAGVLFGLVCYKPHFGLLVPVALVAGRHWLMIAVAAAVVGGLVGLSCLTHGTATWTAYLELFLASGHEYGSGRISFSGMVSTFGASRLAGVPVTLALVLQAISGLAAGIVVAWIWWRNPRQAVRSAALLVGTMLVVPMALLYDQLLTLLALAWLVQDMRRGGSPWEVCALACSFALSIVSFPLAVCLGLPLAPVPPAILLAVCAVRTLRMMRTQQT